MIKENNSPSYATLKDISRIFISLFVFISLILIALVPLFAYTTKANQTQEQSSLDQSTTLEIVSVQETTSSDTSIDDNADSSTESNEVSTEEEIETTVITTGEENNDVASSDSSTQAVLTLEQISVSDIGPTGSTIDTLSTQNTENDSSSAVQQVSLSVTSSMDASNSTGVNIINVATSQTYVNVSAQVSITDQKPQNVPIITLQHENEFIESYIMIDLIGDSVALSDNEIQSMTMTFKIKKNPDEMTKPQILRIKSMSSPTKRIRSFLSPTHSFRTLSLHPTPVSGNPLRPLI